MLNHNGRQHLDDCLRSLEGQTFKDFEVILVDNASSDGSREHVRERYPWVQLLESTENRGYTGGNNLGLRFTKGDWVVFLNNDVMLEPNWLGEMNSFLNSNPDVGACGCKMLDFHNPSLIQTVGLKMDRFGFPSLIGYLEVDEGQQDAFVDEVFVHGACFFIKKEALDRLDEAFDPDYFALAEDIDLSWRTRLLGYRVAVNPNAKVYHKGGSTFKALSRKRHDNRYMSERNTIRNLLKNYATSSLVKIAIPYLALWMAEILFFSFTLRPKMAIANLKAMAWNLAHLKKTLAKRRKIQQTRVISDDSLRDFFVSGSEKLRIFRRSYHEKRNRYITD